MFCGNVANVIEFLSLLLLTHSLAPLLSDVGGGNRRIKKENGISRRPSSQAAKKKKMTTTKNGRLDWNEVHNSYVTHFVITLYRE